MDRLVGRSDFAASSFDRSAGILERCASLGGDTDRSDRPQCSLPFVLSVNAFTRFETFDQGGGVSVHIPRRFSGKTNSF